VLQILVKVECVFHVITTWQDNIVMVLLVQHHLNVYHQLVLMVNVLLVQILKVQICTVITKLVPKIVTVHLVHVLIHSVECVTMLLKMV